GQVAGRAVRDDVEEDRHGGGKARRRLAFGGRREVRGDLARVALAPARASAGEPGGPARGDERVEPQRVADRGRRGRGLRRGGHRGRDEGEGEGEGRPWRS